MGCCLWCGVWLLPGCPGLGASVLDSDACCLPAGAETTCGLLCTPAAATAGPHVAALLQAVSRDDAPAAGRALGWPAGRTCRIWPSSATEARALVATNTAYRTASRGSPLASPASESLLLTKPCVPVAPSYVAALTAGRVDAESVAASAAVAGTLRLASALCGGREAQDSARSCTFPGRHTQDMEALTRASCCLLQHPQRCRLGLPRAVGWTRGRRARSAH